MRGLRRTRTLGISLVAAGLLTLAAPLLLIGYAWTGQARVKAAAPAWQRTVPRAGRTAAASPGIQPEPAPGTVAAELTVPRLGLHLAVLQGTSDGILAIAPGHEPQSVMPGSPGTAVIVAHNLTFFRNLDRLRRGDRVTVQTASGVFTFRVTGHRIVPADRALPNTTQASIALIACYPLNALYLTPERYVVFAALVAPGGSVAALPKSAATPPAFLATLPTDLKDVPLWLSDTNLTVSSADFTGGSTIPLTASGGSWSLVAQSIRMFAATLHALARGGIHPLAGFGPSPALQGLRQPGPWDIRPASAIRITATLGKDGQPTAVAVVLPHASLSSNGGAQTGSYIVTLGVDGDRLYLIRVRWAG